MKHEYWTQHTVKKTLLHFQGLFIKRESFLTLKVNVKIKVNLRKYLSIIIVTIVIFDFSYECTPVSTVARCVPRFPGQLEKKISKIQKIFV